MTVPDRAMVLAAGRGLRMRPLTDRLPKPLVAVGGRPLIDRALDHLVRAGVGVAVVNTHWLGDRIERHLAARRAPEIAISREETLLETGGGVARALSLSLLGERAFFAVNADVLWSDGPEPALARLAAAWRDAAMDALLLVHPVGAAVGYAGAGDFLIGPSGKLTARGRRDRAPLVFTGVQILHPRLFEDAPGGAFSLSALYRRAAGAGRLFGIVHDGAWYHVGTVEAVDEVGSLLGREE